MKRIGIIGETGRMGSELSHAIANAKDFELGAGYSSNSKYALEQVFEDNDYIVDFSKPTLLRDILLAAKKNPKPLLLCSTGWDIEDYGMLIQDLAENAPVVVAPNTSLGAYMQLKVVELLAEHLDNDYDIDIIEKHHRNKQDMPSGTAKKIIKKIIDTKKNAFGQDYTCAEAHAGGRPDNFIGLAVERSGNIFGDHEISFRSDSEVITISHSALSRSLFAKGALKILRTLHNKKISRGLLDISQIF